MRSILGEHFGEDPGPEPRQWVVHLVAAVDEDVLLTTVAVEVTVQNDVIALRYPTERKFAFLCDWFSKSTKLQQGGGTMINIYMQEMFH